MNEIKTETDLDETFQAAALLVREIVQSLVQERGAVVTLVDVKRMGGRILVFVDPADLRYVIGKGGRTAHSLERS